MDMPGAWVARELQEGRAERKGPRYQVTADAPKPQVQRHLALGMGSCHFQNWGDPCLHSPQVVFLQKFCPLGAGTGLVAAMSKSHVMRLCSVLSS